MQVARKLTLPLVLSAFVVLGVASWFSVRQDFALQQEDMQRDQRIYALILQSAITAEASHASTRDALALVNDANRGQSGVLFFFVPDAELASKSSLPPELIERLHGGEAVFRVDEQVWGNASTFVPLSLPDGTRGAIWVREALTTQRESLGRIVSSQIGTFIALGVLWAIVAIGLGAVIIGRPMKELAEKAQRTGRGDLTGPLTITQNDEIGKLAAEMNRMCEELAVSRQRVEAEAAARMQALEQLRHADRLNTVGKLASGLAHEVGTPLNVIAARARMIATGEVVGEAAIGSARIVVQQTESITRIIRQLLDFARRTLPSATHESLDSLVSQTLTMLGPLAEKSKCHLVLQKTAAPLQLEIDRGQVQQALTNVVMNAVQASAGSGGTVSVAVGSGLAKPPADVGGAEGPYAWVSVKDEGSGIPPELLPRVFEPFFTTKDVGEGTGLGLSVAWGIVRDHRGWISVESEVGRGSRFSIYLPMDNVTGLTRSNRS